MENLINILLFCMILIEVHRITSADKRILSKRIDELEKLINGKNISQ